LLITLRLLPFSYIKTGKKVSRFGSKKSWQDSLSIKQNSWKYWPLFQHVLVKILVDKSQKISKVSKILTILTGIDSLKFGLGIDPIDITDSNWQVRKNRRFTSLDYFVENWYRLMPNFSGLHLLAYICTTMGGG
jgi:hypothetical protein